MKIHVRYYGIAHEASGTREETIKLLEGSTIMDLVTNLIEKYGEPLKKLVFDDEGQIFDYLMFSVNNMDIMTMNKFETMLNDEDELLILPPIGGG